MEELTERQKELLATFDSKKPLIVNCGEIEDFKHIAGRFIFRRPTVQDRINIGMIASKEKAGQVGIDMILENLIYILATFDVVIVEHPSEIVFRNLHDMDGIFDLYNRYNEWLSCFRLSIQGDGKAAGTAGK